MPNYHIVGKLGNFADVQKNNMWEIRIGKPAILKSLPVGAGTFTDELLLRARTATIPAATVTTLETDFMGMKQFYAGNTTLQHTLSIDFDEFEDQKSYKYLYEWTNAIFNWTDETNGGHRVIGAADKSKYATDIELKLLKGDGEQMGKKIKFINAFITTFNEASLAYGDASKITYSATFQYDYFKLID